MNHAATAYFFHVNRFLNPSKIMDMNNTETKKEKQHPYVHEAEKQHTDDYLNGKYPFLKFTTENTETYSLGFLRGIAFAAANFETIEAPTVFLQDEPKEEIKIELDEENKRTLHY